MMRQFVPNRACLACQGCCRYTEADTTWSPCVLDEEIKTLLKHKIPPSIISSDRKIRLRPFKENNNYICYFFNPQDNKCKIYNFRPFECRLYPFLIKRQGKSIFLAVDLNCPFVKENLDSPRYKGYCRYLITLFNSPRWQKILKNNPQVIQSYEDTVNISEIKL